MKKMPLHSAAVLCVAALTVSCTGFFSDSIYPGYADGGYIESPDGGDRFEEVDENPFIKTSDRNVSTFSVDADGASYTIMRKYLSGDLLPLQSSVRTEEFLNYFTFNYPDPADGNSVAINCETCGCPWAEGHWLLRLGLKGKSLQDSELPTANYVFLVDVSGSMSSKDKLDLLKSSLITMLDYLRPDDKISIITYSGKVQKLLEATEVREAETIKKAIRQLYASGATAGGNALEMAYKEAKANFIIGGNNRIILGTDGDFNVGPSSDEAIVEIVEKYAKDGIYLTVCGFGSGNLNDSMMKKMSVAGNGTYQYIDSEDEMAKVFVNERSKFVSVANDTKVQITFDKDKVDSYRLIGYERRVMSSQDYEDDSKDAGEIGAGQTITALYELIPMEGVGEGDAVGTFDCRYKKSLGAESLTLTPLEMKYGDGTASPEMSFAAGVAAYSMILRGSKYKGESDFELALELVNAGLSFDPYGYRQQLTELITKAKTLASKE